jgi:hypothetical protein
MTASKSEVQRDKETEQMASKQQISGMRGVYVLGDVGQVQRPVRLSGRGVRQDFLAVS